MRFVYLFLRFFPILAVALSVVSMQFVVYYRRRANKTYYFYMGFIVFLILLSLIWVVFRGDLHSDEWLRALSSD